MDADFARLLHECAERCARCWVQGGLSLQEQEVEEARLLDFKRLRPGQVFKLSRGGSPDIISLMQIYLPLLIQ